MSTPDDLHSALLAGGRESRRGLGELLHTPRPFAAHDSSPARPPAPGPARSVGRASGGVPGIRPGPAGLCESADAPSICGCAVTVRKLQCLAPAAPGHAHARRRTGSLALSGTVPEASSVVAGGPVAGQADHAEPGVSAGRAAASSPGGADEMEPLDREVLALRHYEQLSNRETAAVLDVSEAAASIRFIRRCGGSRNCCSGCRACWTTSWPKEKPDNDADRATPLPLGIPWRSWPRIFWSHPPRRASVRLRSSPPAHRSTPPRSASCFRPWC